jgi:hypothetical protein
MQTIANAKIVTSPKFWTQTPFDLGSEDDFDTSPLLHGGFFTYANLVSKANQYSEGEPTSIPNSPEEFAHQAERLNKEWEEKRRSARAAKQARRRTTEAARAAFEASYRATEAAGEGRQGREWRQEEPMKRPKKYPAEPGPGSADEFFSDAYREGREWEKRRKAKKREDKQR